MNSKPQALNSESVAILGMPFDSYSSHLLGAADAPALIREMMLCESANTSSELGIKLANHSRIVDLGDLSWSSNKEAFDTLEKTISSIVAIGAKSLTFGGDHSITYPTFKGLRQR